MSRAILRISPYSLSHVYVHIYTRTTKKTNNGCEEAAFRRQGMALLWLLCSSSRIPTEVLAGRIHTPVPHIIHSLK